jgi:anti-anti-sigma factor
MATKRIPVQPLHELTMTTDKWNDWHIIALNGKFVVQWFSIVRNNFDAMETGHSPNVAIDMTGITQIDSSALTIVLNFQKRLQEKGGRLVIFGPNAIIKDTLLIVGFNMAVPIYNTRAMFEQSVVSK